MPKCASTSFITLLRSLARPLSFELHFNPSGAYDWNNGTIKREVQLIKSKSKKGRKLLYARHFYYTDFEPYGVTNYTYLTVIREPMARFVSSYLYYHHSSKPYIQKMLKPRYKNESILECTLRGLNGCAHNWLTKYFCGHQTVCKSGNETALARAKANMERHFAAVGVVEDVELTMKVFAKVAPGFFAFSRELPRHNKNERSMDLSVEEEKAVRNANAADLELYAYARELLQATVQSCYIQ
jgi:dermatan/chondrotin sulfate uronyl 2-O-sulfotransferase UST